MASMAGDIRATYSSNIFRDYQSSFETKALEQLFTSRKFVDVCTYFMTLDPISAQVRKLAKLAITEFTFEGGTEVSELYQEIFERLGMHAGGHTLDEIGMELLGYGNSLVSIYYPFSRTFICKSCKRAVPGMEMFESKKFKEFKVHKWGLSGAPCPLCGSLEGLRVKDMSTKTSERAKLTRWSIRDMDIKYIKSAGERIYVYKPGAVERRLLKEDRDIDHWRLTPWDIIVSAHDDREIRFYDSMVYHLRGPSINGLDSPWGLPLILPAMLLAMNMQQLRKANDVAAQDRAMAHTFIYPESVPGMENPAYKINLEKWSSYVANEISIQKMDPARKSYVPFPLGQLGVGGDAKVLMMYPEIRQLQEDISVALGLPAEFVFGGGNYASGVVSHRFVSMFLQTLQLEYVGFANWLINNLRTVYNLPKTKASMRPPKMADDVQLYQLYMGLMQGGYMGPETFYEKTGLAKWDEVKKDLERNNTFLAGQMKKQMLAQLDGTAAQQILQTRMMPQQMAQQNAEQVPPPEGTGQPTPYPPEVVEQLQQQGVDPQMINDAQQQGISPDQLMQFLQQQQQASEQSPYVGADGGVKPIKYPVEILSQLIQMGIPSEVIFDAEKQGMTPDVLVEQFQQEQQQGGAPGQEGGSYPPELIEQLRQMGIPDEVIQQASQQGMPPDQLVQQAQQMMQPPPSPPPAPQQQNLQPRQQMGNMAPSPQSLQQIVQKMLTMPPDQVQQFMDSMMTDNPAIHALVTQYMQQAPSAASAPQGSAGAGVDMRPMPQQLPPRRSGGV